MNPLSCLFSWYKKYFISQRDKGVIRDVIRGRILNNNGDCGAVYQDMQLLWAELDMLKQFNFPERIEARKVWKNAGRVRMQKSILIRTCVTACFLFSLGLIWHIDPIAQSNNSYMTIPGERTQITLADGTIIDLNTATRMEVSMYRTRREVKLQHGEALFKVYPDQRRPFIVYTGESHIRVLGTIFNVFRKSDTIDIAVVEGKVATNIAQNKEPFMLNSGDKLSFNMQGQYRRGTVSPENIGIWRTGKIAFNDMPLSEVIAEMRRYGLRSDINMDTGAEEMRISGIFRTEEPLALVRALSDVLPVTVSEYGDHISITANH